MKKKSVALLVLVLAVQLYFNNACRSYAFDKGALFTVRGVFCERTVTDSFTAPYLPLEGARRQFEYGNKIDPRFIIPTPVAPGA